MLKIRRREVLDGSADGLDSRVRIGAEGVRGDEPDGLVCELNGGLQRGQQLDRERGEDDDALNEIGRAHV